MDDLSLLLASRDLFLSLSTQKIKTLKQAETLLKTIDNPKLQSILEEYHKIQDNVFLKLNEASNILKEQLKFDTKDPLNLYWHVPSIIQVIGVKGSGKTALSLQLAANYALNSPEKLIKILNCTGGITANRLNKFQKIKYEYFDIFSVEDLLELLNKFKRYKKKGLLVLDGVDNLIFSAVTQRLGLGEIFLSLKDLGWTLIITNYVQGKLQIQQKQVLNPMGYFPNIFGGIVDCKLSIAPDDLKDCNYRICTLKNVNNHCYSYTATMDTSGLSKLTLL